MRSDSRQGDGHVALCVHPPERRRRAGNVAACGCCCCCCCLHSIGGLIGSAVAGRSKTLEARSATATYWLCLLFVIAVAFALLVVVAAGAVSPGADDWSLALLFIAMLLPAGQLGASLIAGVIAGIAMGPKALPRIWGITWRGFMGAVIGLGIMLIPLFGANESPGPMFLVIMGLLVVSAFLYWLRRRGQRASHAPW